MWISESAGNRDRMERAVEDIDLAVMEIGCVQAATGSSAVNGQAFIDGTVRGGWGCGDDGHNRGALEGRERAVLAGEDEGSRARRADAVVHDESGAAVKDDSSRIALRAAGARNRKGCLNRVSGDVVQ